jgi:DNA repair protein RecN (Recombination protein N)
MALRSIMLRDFVIVQQLELELAEGFTALTGETGAGKSILIDALQLALGARADVGLVREGASRTEVCAEFDTPPTLHAWLEENGFAVEEQILLRRTLDAQGKSRAWLNGTPATAAQLRAAGEYLLDIHGQHAWQSLTRPEAVRGLLDAYAGLSGQAVAECWQRWRAARKALEQAQSAQEHLERDRERLLWQIAELDKLAPGADEWEELNAQHTRLSHAQALLDTAHAAVEWLNGEDHGALSGLSRAGELLQEQAHLEPEFRNLHELLASSLAQAEEAARSLQAYLRHVDLDPQGLAALDERVALWLNLARRYKRPPAELSSLLATWKQELQRLEACADIAGLEAVVAQTAAAFDTAARQLSRQRAKAAPQLAQAITQAMQLLGMQGGHFEVALNPSAQPGAHGIDDVAFLLAGHPGATARPLGKIASGGELSRISLAIAVTTSALGEAPTLIFDEVDAGVGGAVAEAVGRLMRQLGQDRQVLAVTHLPQVAAQAHQHLLVVKHSDGQGTSSSVQPVAATQRVREIARMLGGQQLSSTSLAHAQEMLDLAITNPVRTLLETTP